MGIAHIDEFESGTGQQFLDDARTALAVAQCAGRRLLAGRAGRGVSDSVMDRTVGFRPGGVDGTDEAVAGMDEVDSGAELVRPGELR